MRSAEIQSTLRSKLGDVLEGLDGNPFGVGDSRERVEWPGVKFVRPKIDEAWARLTILTPAEGTERVSLGRDPWFRTEGQAALNLFAPTENEIYDVLSMADTIANAVQGQSWDTAGSGCLQVETPYVTRVPPEGWLQVNVWIPFFIDHWGGLVICANWQGTAEDTIGA